MPMSGQFLSFERIRRAGIVGLGLTTFLVLLVPPAVQADTADITSSPPDRTTSSRPALAEDRPIRPLAAIKPDFFQKEVTNSAGNGEPSLAVNPSNTQQIVATTFAGSWGANATLFFSQDGGGTWTAEATVPQPPGIAAAFLTNVPCPCDQTVEYGRD